MATAHPDNGGIQVFSRTQSAEQIEAALTAQGYEGFEAETYSTAPIAPPETPPAEVQAPPEQTEEQKHAKPGRRERQLARANKEIEALRAENAKRDLEFAELRGRIEGISSVRTTPVAEPAPVVEEPKTVEPPPVVEEAPAALARPKREQFFESEDPDSAYEDAVADWKYDTRKAQEKAEETRQAHAAAEQTRIADEKKAADEQKAHQKKVADRWNDACVEAKKDFPDFDTIMSKEHFDQDKKPLAIVSGPMSHVARRMKAGPKILYWLGTHPEEANKIASKTTITDPSDEWAIEAAMQEVRTEFGRIEAELKAAPAPKKEEKPPAVPVVEDEDPDEDDEELEVDPHIPVAAPPDHGRKVEQPPAAGTIDTKPPAQKVPIASLPVGDKSEPVARVGNRQTHVNRSLLDTPPEVLRDTRPDDYRKRRALEGSTAARG